MNIIESIILGIVQGLTEFLPVSSSGHLVLAGKLLGITTENIRFMVVVHLGTLLALLAVYRVQVGRIVRGLLWGRVRYRRGRWTFSDPYTRLGWLLFLGTIPAGIVGILIGRRIGNFFNSPFLVGVCLAVTGLVLFCVRLIRPKESEPNWWRTIIIGVAQAVAILPGMSRSGLTITAGIYSGVEKSRAAEFSFLLSVPVILCAGALEVGQMIKVGLRLSEVLPLLAAFGAAAISGYLAIRFMLRIIKKGRLYYFAYYCWLVALIVFIFYI